ncbi:MAG: DNA-processing protein DprA [Gammaproteobacteria bacterium]|nr:DNA-processing protein DprA [Gammaproteobacteria bacterium]
MTRLDDPDDIITLDDLTSRLALHRANLPTHHLYQLLNQYDSATAILELSNSQLEQAGLTADAITRLRQPDWTSIDKDLAWADKNNHHILYYDHPDYPVTLKNLDQSPYLLFAAGDLDYLHQPQLAIVGSRSATASGLRTAKEFAEHLSNAGITITSGLARGIDGACHQGALAGLAGTVAVVANGLDQVYPKSHLKLAQSIVNHGCIISESPLGTAPHKGLFPRRNRIISGLSLGTLVVEAAVNSGSLITARHAMEQGREVFAIPGSIHNPLARGCHHIIRQGAKLVETAEDILEELLPLVNLDTSSHTIAEIREEQAEKHLEPAYQALLASMEYEPASIDELVEKSSLAAAEIASMLLILELQGYVVSTNGQYMRVTKGA